MDFAQRGTPPSRSIGSRTSGLRSAVAILLIALAADLSANSRCPDAQRQTAQGLSMEAANTADDIDRLILLKRSLKVCPEYTSWIELGKVELVLENYIDAAYAFEKAADFYVTSGKTEFTVSELQRSAVANAWLAETYALNDELAYALVATQEAAAGFNAVGQAVPDRLLVLQAKLDDATSQADATVLARSFEIQHQRATRGIGVRPRLSQEAEAADVVEETQLLMSDYAGETVESPIIVAENLVVEPETTTSEEPVASESRMNIPVLFEFDSATLTPASLASIEQLGKALQSLKLTPNDSVLVVGHTDSRGAAAYNLSLSEQRAQSVASTLSVLLGNQVRLVAEGRGETELRYTGGQPDDHRRNRRVELIVLRS